MSFDAYLQRADDYILKQIQKFEQQKRGNRSPPRANGYHQMPRYQSQQHGRTSSQGGYPSSPAPPGNQYLAPPAGPMLPEEWAQEFDSQSQRWYYVHKPTGRSQWNPPSQAPPRATTFQPDTQMPSPYQQFTQADEASLRARSNSQPQRPGSNGGGQFLDPRQHGTNVSGSPGLHTQLPPGTHLDMKTGKIVNSMFPEGQTLQSWSQEVQRI
ncbi:hypothetical protein yc1106_06135 [Curvularia clavata]|uniref:WW domain-containing protein n=1 Tax=Curvularia clavata TaxID=95742 RepID=A0A9Q9DUY3_CURCL|nr:hypothetical protein yc1106_06135 [Curvularia clavata]